MLCTCLESIINVTLDLEENKKPNPYGKAKYIIFDRKFEIFTLCMMLFPQFTKTGKL